ncbi:TetR/AcrR family transcriptional regulator [Actinomadura rudentiformis]|uniref:TetR/AcrR family transcriptional regulator n=1 Tax=Actinomadura rudentiformis TaxID=359158 RepID=A0A6H9YTP1_9ACTN|nr:TetR/AcrR family transcriptional regulator [Actinomadura rudentiformis]KAB2344678.1 TetR/AcrR family transcriptional regulator [Actinomadura rudentiformis]
MGNREDLLEGAKRCLLEKGYTRTTARDIAAAAGVSLAAIGYHFGSKDVLLTEALRQAIEEWGDDMARISTASKNAVDADPAERFAATWTKVTESFAQSRALWSIQFEMLAYIERDPGLRQTFAKAGKQARMALVDLFGIPASVTDPQEVEKIGAYYQTLLSGLAAQWLLDPETAPCGRDLIEAAQTVAKGLPIPTDSRTT